MRNYSIVWLKNADKICAAVSPFFVYSNSLASVENSVAAAPMGYRIDSLSWIEKLENSR